MTDAEREALIEKTADGIGRAQRLPLSSEWCRHAAQAALAVAIPIIRKDVVEEAAMTAEHLNGWGSDCGRGGHAEHIAKIIRKLSEAE